ncbi:DUF3310 domain-containing protein [Acuticoccus sp. M5D2P5]|uniref:DUF3310 domain-containing protein n=1 Tax=Acuticoccus kalidii TaxID=2910977 RepID=UPI001F401BE4|nr:DUF3310 domain-containing protein [Acuticoccus kalidii]MCF3933286.1 DUF3310 domain-containing protein [Acuticoccus kalidii]
MATPLRPQQYLDRKVAPCPSARASIRGCPVDRPLHYTSHPSGVECITITEHMPFCEGSAMKYLFRAGLKGDRLEDLRKAEWYVKRAIALEERRRTNGTGL